MSSPMEWVAGNPARLRLQHLILNLLLFIGLLTGLFFGVTDVVVGLDPVHTGFDLLLIVLFCSLYCFSRFRGPSRTIAHLATVLGLVLAASNFVINSGIRGPALMVVLVVSACVTMLHTWRAALAYLAFGGAISTACFLIQFFHPEWIVNYGSAHAEFWDIALTYLFCFVVIFAVMRLVLSFFQQILDQTKAAQDAVTQSEKMASLGQILAGMNHEISTPVGVIGSSLSVTDQWWKDELPRFPLILAGLNAAQTEAFWSLVNEGRVPSGARDTRQRRTRRNELAASMSFLSPEEALSWAEEWEGVGITQWRESWRSLFDEPSRAGLLFAVKLLACHHSHQNAVLAFDKLGTLVRALRSYSRSDAPETAPQLTRLDEGLETVLTLYGAGHRFTVEILRDYHEVPPVLARSDELIQVWTNLVQNALQSMGHHGLLTVGLHEHQGWAIVTISDTGPGVPVALREKIFEPFFTTKDRDHGTGLGLGIVKKLVAGQGGTIHVDDAPGGGARFTVRLPLPQASRA